MSISIAGLWRDGRELAETHTPTVVPIAAAFIFLPQVIWAVITGPTDPQATGFSTTDVVGSLVTGALALVGQIAIAAIMLGGADGPRDVADALRRGMQLVPRLLLAALIVAAIAAPILMLATLVTALIVGGGDEGAPLRIMRVLALPLLFIATYAGGRLFMLIPVLVDQATTARQGIVRSWHLSAARPWPLIGFVLSWMVLIAFLTSLIRLVGDGVFGLLLGPGSRLGFLLTTTFAGLIATAIGLITIGASVAAYRSIDRRLS